MDVTYVPMARGFVYLAAVLDWHTPGALVAVIDHHGHLILHRSCAGGSGKTRGGPDIFNTDSGSQFTSEAFTGVLRDKDIAISMDGRGAWAAMIYLSNDCGDQSNTRTEGSHPTDW